MGDSQTQPAEKEVLRDLKLNKRGVFERSSNSASRKKVLRFSNSVIVEDEILRDPQTQYSENEILRDFSNSIE